MGKKKKQKGSGAGYLLLLLGLAGLAAGVIVQFGLMGDGTPAILTEQLGAEGKETIRYGVMGGGLLAVVLGWMIRPRKVG